MSPYHRLVISFAKTRPGAWFFVHLAPMLDRPLMRMSGGQLSTGIGTEFRDNAVLLICRGARSGTERHVPLLATFVDDAIVLIASRGGDTRHPAWYHNLKAHPRCRVLVRGRGELACVAHEAEGEERARCWDAAVELYEGYASYQERCAPRRIPVMVLRPEPATQAG